MTINLRILVPEATTNYILNPSFRYGTTGWNAVGATISRTLDQARFGIASLKVVTSGAALNEGAYYRVSALQGITSPITDSIYIRGSGKVRVRLKDSPLGSDYVSETINLDPDIWRRVIVTGAIYGNPAADDVRLYVETADDTPKAITFYVDGAQMELKPYATTYCDGDQEGCQWNIENSNSLSTRNGDTRKGGRWVDLAGPCRGNDNLYVTELGGMGMAPISRQVQQFAIEAGGFNQGYKVNNRTTTWNFYAKNETGETTPSLSPLHELRQQLIDIIKPDLTLADEPFLLEYSDTNGSKPLYGSFRYDSGLEGGWDIRNGFFTSFPVRMIAVDPFWYEDNQNVQQLTINHTAQTTVESALWSIYDDRIINNGQPSGTAGNFIFCMAEAPDGTIYLGMSESSAVASVYRFDGSNFTRIGQSNASIITSVAVGPDGTVYAGGAFTTMEGIAINKLAQYNPSTGLWSAVGDTSTFSAPTDMIVANNGQLYCVGSFTSVNASVAAKRIARYDSGTWRTVGAASGVDGSVLCIAQGIDPNTLYIGGSFTKSFDNAVTYNRVASIDITTNLLSQMGYGVSDGIGSTKGVWDIAVGPDGTVYAGGDFSTQGSPGTDTLNNVAQWNGGNLWKPLADGLTRNVTTTYIVKNLEIGKNGELYASGQFTLSGTKEMFGFAKWYGNVWNPVELTAGKTPSYIAFLLYTKANYLLASTLVSASSVKVITPADNIVENTGTRMSYPYMYILGQGTVKFIKNIKTNQGLYLNLEVQQGEEVFIDFARGEIVSTVRGSLVFSILPGSEIRGINLLPGENNFSVLIVDDVNCVAQLRYVPKHWSVDAIVNASPL